MILDQANRFRAELAAAQLWEKYGFETPHDLELDVLAYARGVFVMEERLDSSDARLVRKGNRGFVRVNRDIAEPGRKRFAIAHELGHFEIHKEVSQLSACTSQDMIGSYKGSTTEIEANWFAAELLMPKSHFIKKQNDQFPSFAVVRELADYFRTTLIATAIRLAELSEERVAIVICESGKVRWWRASNSFREHYRINAGMKLKEESAAGWVCLGHQNEGKPVSIDSVAWNGPVHEEDWWEDVLVQEKYGQVLSLIRAA